MSMLRVETAEEVMAREGSKIEPPTGLAPPGDGDTVDLARHRPAAMTAQDLLRELRAEFTARMAQKTGWGRNDVVQEYDQAVAATLARRIRLA